QGNKKMPLVEFPGSDFSFHLLGMIPNIFAVQDWAQDKQEAWASLSQKHRRLWLIRQGRPKAIGAASLLQIVSLVGAAAAYVVFRQDPGQQWAARTAYALGLGFLASTGLLMFGRAQTLVDDMLKKFSIPALTLQVGLLAGVFYLAAFDVPKQF